MAVVGAAWGSTDRLGVSNMTTALSSQTLPTLGCQDFYGGGFSGQDPDVHAAIKAMLIAFRSLVASDPMLNLAAARAAQLNRCALSLATHVELAKFQGEHPLRLCHLAAWRDSNLFGPRERAAFEWTESISISPASISSELVDDLIDAGLSSKDMSDLSLVVASVNLCSRLCLIAAMPVPA
jgi:AhpD family alkylhydroperoxidase